MSEGVSQRDRYLAFAFAAADVLIEIKGDGTVTFATGSVKTVFGTPAKQLEGQSLGAFIHLEDAVAYHEFCEKLKRLGRASEGEFQLSYGDEKDARGTVRISAMRSTQIADLYHLSIKTISGRAARSGYDVASPLAKSAFADHAKDVVKDAQAAGASPDLAIMDLNFAKMETELGKPEAAKLESRLVQTMESWAFDGSGVGKLGKGRYSVLMDQETGVGPLTDRLADTAAQEHPELELDVFGTSIGISDVIDTDDFDSFLNSALTKFNTDKANYDRYTNSPAKMPSGKKREKSVDWRKLK